MGPFISLFGARLVYKLAETASLKGCTPSSQTISRPGLVRISTSDAAEASTPGQHHESQACADRLDCRPGWLHPPVPWRLIFPVDAPSHVYQPTRAGSVTKPELVPQTCSSILSVDPPQTVSEI